MEKPNITNNTATLNYNCRYKVINNNRIICIDNNYNRYRIRNFMENQLYNPTYPEYVYVDFKDELLDISQLHNEYYKGTVFRFKGSINNIKNNLEIIKNLKKKHVIVSADIDYKDLITNFVFKDFTLFDFIYIRNVKRSNDIKTAYSLTKILDVPIIISLNYSFNFERLLRINLHSESNLYLLIESSCDIFTKKSKYLSIPKITDSTISAIMKNTTSNILLDDIIKITNKLKIFTDSQKIFINPYKYSLYINTYERTYAIPFLAYDSFNDINNIEHLFNNLKEK